MGYDCSAKRDESDYVRTDQSEQKCFKQVAGNLNVIALETISEDSLWSIIPKIITKAVASYWVLEKSSWISHLGMVLSYMPLRNLWLLVVTLPDLPVLPETYFFNLG